MFRLGSIFLASVYSLVLKICGLIYKYVYRSKLSGVEENYSNFSGNGSQNGSEFLQSGLISKCQVMCGKDVSGFLEEAKIVKLVVQEMFVGSDDVLVRSDHNLGSEISEKNPMDFDEESDSCSFHFDLLNGFCSTNQDSQEQISMVEDFDQEREGDDHFNIDQESVEDDHSKIDQEREDDLNIDQEKVEDDHSNIGQESVEDDHSKIDQERKDDHHFNVDQEKVEDDHHSKIDQEREDDHHFNTDQEKVENDHSNIGQESVEDDHFKIDQEREDNLNLDSCEDKIPEEQDFSYEVELLPSINPSAVANQESGSENWMSDFLDQTDQEYQEDPPEERDFDYNLWQKVETLDEEYIELENLSFRETHTDKESTSCDDSNDVMQTEATASFQSCWGTKSDGDEDEPDVLSEHQNLVQQMKMELKACRIKGLPTISEECESPKMLEDLKPLEIDHKIEYKDIMDEIQKFHKIFSVKMRKLDVLSYQTLHAISFLHLKDCEEFTAGKKKADLLPSVLPKIWQRKVQRIYADPMHKSVTEMHRDLELVYVGQLCLSWEILSWLYVKARELLDYDCEGNHSYNRAAEEFQQFQVLMQRFMEDEPFQQHRNWGYVRNLFHVPIIRDDCLKIKKERGEKLDAVSLEMLVEIIRESMLIFREFLFADKKSSNIATKVDLQDLGNSELLSNVVSNLQKKERKMRESINSRNCIVKKLRGRRGWRLDREMLTCEIELRLVVRVVNVSRLTGDQLVWCRKKLENISFVGRKVQIEPSFLLFPC